MEKASPPVTYTRHKIKGNRSPLRSSPADDSQDTQKTEIVHHNSPITFFIAEEQVESAPPKVDATLQPPIFQHCVGTSMQHEVEEQMAKQGAEWLQSIFADDPFEMHVKLSLACQMLYKIGDMLIAVPLAFRGVQMEPFQLTRPSIYYDLSSYPTKQQLMNIYSRVIHLPSRYIETFEEACYTGFFDYLDVLFSPYESSTSIHASNATVLISMSLAFPRDRQRSGKGGVVKVKTEAGGSGEDGSGFGKGAASD